MQLRGSIFVILIYREAVGNLKLPMHLLPSLHPNSASLLHLFVALSLMTMQCQAVMSLPAHQKMCSCRGRANIT